MGCTNLDLTIDDALADPVIAAAMRADHVDPRGLESLLRTKARHLSERRAPPSALRAHIDAARTVACAAAP